MSFLQNIDAMPWSSLKTDRNLIEIIYDNLNLPYPAHASSSRIAVDMSKSYAA